MRYAAVVTGVVGVLLALFLATESLAPAPLGDPDALLASHPLAGALGVSLLVGDVLLPVPSSAVMVAHGALFGLAVGAGLSLLGSLGAAALAFWLGSRGAPLLDSLLGAAERERADALLTRWGGLAVLLTRPLPIAAEAVALLAGASPMRWRELLTMAALGSAPAALLYAWVGAAAVRIDGGAWVLAAVALLAAVAAWARGRSGGALAS